jgi:hypothetical protein
LIDVGTNSTSPHLCEGKYLELGTNYATLIHCRGKQKIVTVTRDTIGLFQGRIAMEILPETFQDAIAITRRLAEKYGIRHLWIDSLCIMQDSLEDWNAEAPRMAEVYGNCWCNIAATQAPDGRSGLFSSRDPTKLQPIFLKLPEHNNPEPVDHLCVSSSRWHDNVDNAPLNQRAWVTQERFLSPRMLHIAGGEIFFECQVGRAPETFFEGEPTATIPRVFAENGYGPIASARSSVVKTNMKQAIIAWSWQVSRYSCWRLTKQTDKLVAISGIAKVFETFFKGNDYLAGLWKLDLVKQLAWSRILRPFSSGKQNPEYLAPSWSWASVGGSLNPSWWSTS